MISRFSRPALAAVAALLLPVGVLAATARAATAAGFAAACPARGQVSQHYSAEHNGIDIANDYGTPIYAVGDGQVLISGTAQGYGQWIRILHPDGTITEYGHMYERDVAAGDHVTAGQQIALMGSEGEATGPHLHLRVWADPDASVRTDPEPYLTERGVTVPCVPGSGPSPAPLVYPAESGRVVSARSADGRLEVFAAGANGVSHAWQTAINGAWSEWEDLGGPGGAQLAIGPNADGRLEVFAINGSTFQHRYQLQPSGAWSGWEDFGSGGHDIAVGSNQDGRLEVFASGPVGVYHRYQTAPNGGWSGWDPTGAGPTGAGSTSAGSTGAGPANSEIELGKAPDGRLEVFALNGSTFQHQWQTAVNGAWSGWEDFGTGGHDLTVSHNQDGRLEVLASGPAGVYHKYQTSPTSWSGWDPTGGPADSRLTSRQTADGRVEVFAINGSTAQHIWQTGLNAPYGQWDTFGTGGTEIAAATNADGRIEVFASNTDGVHHKWQTGFSTWSDWTWLNTTPGPAVSRGAIR
ncbi:peptidoglycan DD-metalloendopeptidase family protein [Kitasatospora sp. NPDC048286]|uniref:peptidoglycan DD-metalloendopeptidase family protein n=1 Tax=Kitasatospora sp. NPDC048286 TaxID=3364047 RepID=UPI0037225971